MIVCTTENIQPLISHKTSIDEMYGDQILLIFNLKQLSSIDSLQGKNQFTSIKQIDGIVNTKYSVTKVHILFYTQSVQVNRNRRLHVTWKTVLARQNE